jgi:ketosteroid isomerase-like protein
MLIRELTMELRKLGASISLAAFMAGAAAAAAPVAPPPTNAELKKQVIDTERAFAATMKARDHAAFAGFLAEDTIFFSGPGRPLYGKEAVAREWKGFYDKPAAPFSWDPDEVEVLASGTLAFSTGPVYDPSGKLVSRFSSVWRQETPGQWRIVFDRGWPVCDCKK